MGDCFPRTGGHIPISDACKLRTGVSEYGMNYKQWPNPVHSPSFSPSYGSSGLVQYGGADCGGDGGSTWKQRYSFSKGARFRIPTYCDCTPPPERCRFETTYAHDFDMHHDKCNRQMPTLLGVKPRIRHQLPKQYLCPFTTDTTYARAFDMSQTNFQPLCAQQDFQQGACCGGNPNACSDGNVSSQRTNCGLVYFLIDGIQMC